MTTKGWIGAVPVHWTVSRTKHVAKLESGHTPSRQHPEYWQDCTIPWFTLADVWQIRDGGTDFVSETKERISELGLQNSAARLLPAGTVLLSRTASVGFAAIAKVPLATTQDFVNWICSPRILPKYLLYVFRAMGGEFRRLTMGSTHQTIYMPDVANFTTPVPPLEEQRAIADFLDRETARIDRTVQKHRDLLSALTEAHQAAVTQTTSAGIGTNGTVEEILGAMTQGLPAGWRLWRLKHLSPRIGVGVVVNPSTYVATTGLPFVYGGDIREGLINSDDARRISKHDSDSLPQSRLNEGDILIVRVGAPGVAAVVPPELEGANCASVVIVRGSSHFNSDWLCFAINSRFVRWQVEVVQYGAAQEQFNVAHAVDFWIPTPPRSQQDRIAQELSNSRDHLNKAVAKIEIALSRLSEWRSALITAAVTGQIDVREGAGFDSQVPLGS